MSVSPEFVEVNKGNKKHKAAGAGQLLRCPGLLKDNNKKSLWKSAGIPYCLPKL